MKQKHDYPDMTAVEWLDRGEILFGKNQQEWRFKCPMCGHKQKAADFKQYKDQGATPDSARQECIGRYQDKARKAFGENKKSDPKSPCDYAAYGLFRIGVKVKFDNGKDTISFPFDEE